MKSPTSLGASTTLSQPTKSWETIGDFPVNEGPAALYHGGATYLTYSASYCWTTSYQLGLLTYKGSGDPTSASSWTKSGPVFSSANGNYGTGHNGYVSSCDCIETLLRFLLASSAVLTEQRPGTSITPLPTVRDLVTATDIPRRKRSIGTLMVLRTLARLSSSVLVLLVLRENLPSGIKTVRFRSPSPRCTICWLQYISVAFDCTCMCLFPTS